MHIIYNKYVTISWWETIFTYIVNFVKIGNCGPNTICDFQNMSICSCLPGYTSNWPNGCTQKTKSSCDHTNKCVNVRGLKLPEPSNVDVYTGLRFGNCQNLCLGNCSCNAFTLIDDDKCIIWSASVSDISRHSSTGRNLYVRRYSQYDNRGMSEHSFLKVIYNMHVLQCWYTVNLMSDKICNILAWIKLSKIVNDLYISQLEILSFRLAKSTKQLD